MLNVFPDKKDMGIAAIRFHGGCRLEILSRPAHCQHIRGYPDPRGWTDIRTLTDGYPASADMRPTLSACPAKWQMY
jgi:hypothetical protein